MLYEPLRQQLKPHSAEETAALAVIAVLPEVDLITEMVRRVRRDEFAAGARIGRREMADELGIRSVARAHDMA